MQCPSCKLRYNLTARKPKIYPCSHTICEFCQKDEQFCPKCKVALDHSKALINDSLMEIVKEDKKDIDKMIKACFVGSASAGKTSLIRRLKGQKFTQKIVPTIGIDFAYVDRQIEGGCVRFQLWDSAGQQKFRAISPINYKNADIVFIVYDMTQKKLKEQVTYWIQQSNKHSPQNAINIIVGNKLDLLESLNLTRQSPLDQETIKQHNLTEYQISCKTNQGIEQLWLKMESLQQPILNRRVLQPDSTNNNKGTTKLKTAINKESTISSEEKTCRC